MTTPNDSNDLIKIHVFRPLDGLRAPYTISIDRARNVVSDELDQVAFDRIKGNPHLLARHRIDDGSAPPSSAPPSSAESHQDLLQRQGLHKHITDEGIVISREPPDAWSLNFDDWLTEEKPNPFAGSDDLRADYFAERDEVQKRVNAGNCPGCELTRLQVTYRIRLRELLAAK